MSHIPRDVVLPDQLFARPHDREASLRANAILAKGRDHQRARAKNSYPPTLHLKEDSFTFVSERNRFLPTYGS